MTFSRQAVAEQDRRRALAQGIVDRHTEEECERIWRRYCEGIGGRTATKYYVKMRKASPELVANLLKPGELDRTMMEDG